MPHRPLSQAAQYVAAGATYLVLSGVLYLFWLAIDNLLVLFFALSTLVAALVTLSVGWPRLRRERAARKAAGTRDAGAPQSRAVGR